jgi:hypothetical protein
MIKKTKKTKPASKLPLVDSKLTGKAKEAQDQLTAYFKKNKLDPTKDWTKDKKHGEKVKNLVAVVNVSRKKIEDAAPVEIHHKKKDDKPKKASASTTYDYPKVDGREMTAVEKKKYRTKMRNEKAGKTPKEAKVEKTSAKPKKEEAKVEAKVPAKASVEAKPKKKFLTTKRAKKED